MTVAHIHLPIAGTPLVHISLLVCLHEQVMHGRVCFYKYRLTQLAIVREEFTPRLHLTSPRQPPHSTRARSGFSDRLVFHDLNLMNVQTK